MNPENTPPPMPERKARVSSHQYGVEESCTAKNQPSMGMINSSDELKTSLRVPRMGGKNMKMRRKIPHANPGMAVSQ